MRLNNYKTIVTGGSSGIGKAIVDSFLLEGAKVAVIDKDPTPNVEPKRNPNCLFVKADVTKSADIGMAAKEAVKWLGGLDTLVNNAGFGLPGTLLETTETNWHQMLAVNLTGPFLVSQVLMPHLIQSKGSIIMMASVAGMVGIKERTAYCATKGGVISLMRSIALDYVGEGVRCNAICPGTVDTPWVDRMVATYPDPVQTKKQMTNRQPMGRLGQPHEIASGAVYLASKDSNFVTGSCLVIDGGLTMQ